jgi:poly-gamma-glutamate capsule biosynthesis protein CapA/YwtB (metallophosphatase superfamily)
VLPFLHWGWENEPGPSARQRELAHALIDAGADAVIGSHPHVTQGAEMYRGKPIVYSLGNFVFDLLDRPENADGWVLELVVDRNGVRRFSTRAVHIDEQGTPAPVAGSATPCGVRGAGVVDAAIQGLVRARAHRVAVARAASGAAMRALAVVAGTAGVALADRRSSCGRCPHSIVAASVGRTLH